MPSNSLRFVLLKALFAELYKKCGFMTISNQNTYLPVEKLYNGTVKVLGRTFDMALRSHPFVLQRKLILLCDLCLSTPTKECIDNFAQKLRHVKDNSDLEIEGVIAFINPLDSTLACYARALGVQALTYHNNPILSPFLNEIELLCGSYLIKNVTEQAVYFFGDAFAGFLQKYCPLQYIESFSLFKNGSQIMFINIFNTLASIRFSLLGITSGGFLVHLFGTEDCKFELEHNTEVICLLKTKTKNGLNYKALCFKNKDGAFTLSLPSGISKCALFNHKHNISLISSVLKTDCLKIE